VYTFRHISRSNGKVYIECTVRTGPFKSVGWPQGAMDEFRVCTQVELKTKRRKW